jgi:hypothetical protein
VARSFATLVVTWHDVAGSVRPTPLSVRRGKLPPALAILSASNRPEARASVAKLFEALLSMGAGSRTMGASNDTLVRDLLDVGDQIENLLVRQPVE